MNPRNCIGWFGIVRLGFVQAALGAIVVIATSTMNRVMVVELALPAMLPGALVALHYAVQILRPRLGFGSDVGGRRTPWIIGGIGVLGVGGVLAAIAIGLMATQVAAGIALAVLAFMLIGVGVGAAGTSLLVLLAKQVEPGKRAAAATIVWMMMILGFVATTVIVGNLLDPYSAERLVAITAAVAVAALAIALVATFGLERPSLTEPEAAKPPFKVALREVWSESRARRFTIFVFVSMLAYSAQDLILEPFAGSVFGFTPGESTKLAGVQHGGVFVGMILVALAGTGWRGRRIGSLQQWTVGGCVASCIALAALAFGGLAGSGWPLRENVFLLGVANGAFAVAAIGSMMSYASDGRTGREGVRMGLWGAAQAIAFGIGGFAGAAASDVARAMIGADGPAYALVFAAEALMFLVAARLASRLTAAPSTRSSEFPSTAGAQLAGQG
ncbi:BCD family MFS transporter [Nevskia sp.]|uniref:BCD family MFS transporter n=1 Tax=Nevskia sp. TaxID=1929292 RepID=UPI0025D429B3|nr:BCD family MFS transporter [Nevskia sp.]